MRIAGRCERSDLYSASVALYSLEEVRSVTEDCNTAPHDRPRWLVSLVILLALAFGSGCDKKSNPASPGPQPTPQTRIVFASGRDGNVEIYIMNADGTDQKRLTNDPIYDISPAWLPGGRQVLYVKDWGAGHSLHRMNDDGTNDVLIDSVPGLYISGAPRVSPDGSLILCSRGTPAIKPHIWLMNLDATDGHYLTEGQVEEGDPDWSPDGTRIVFSRNIPSSGWTIYTMNADGSDTLNVGGAGVGQGHPRWSPDGTQIVYTQAGSSIYVMAPDGSGRRRVKPVQGGAD